MWERELEVLRDELFNVRPPDLVAVLEFHDFQDVNRPESSTVPSRHVLVESLNRIRSRHLAILLVHIVCARSRIVSDPNPEILHFQGSSLMDLAVIVASALKIPKED
jgi:hypothetical protein